MDKGVNVPAAAEEKKKSGPLQAVFNVLGVLLCIVFIPVIIINIVMIVSSYTDKDHIPSAFGYSPVIVLSGSMSPTFEAGDLIVIKKADPYSCKENEVICYLEEETAVTHRILSVEEVDGEIMYVTQGDANNVEDLVPVNPEQVQGKYTGIHLAGVGRFALYLQSPQGMLIFIGGPILLFILWDVLRRSLLNKKAKKVLEEGEAVHQQEMAAMEEELRKLREQVSTETAEQAEEAAEDTVSEVRIGTPPEEE